MASYIPPKDANFSTWLANFSTLITASPTTYGLLASDAVVIAAQNTAWAAAYALAISPSTRTPTTVQAKDVARINALATVRPYAQLISNNAGVSSSNKTALGINPRTNGPTPITAPTTNPNLTIQSASVLTHVLRYRDSAASPTVKAKPAGAIALQLYAKASATPITDPAALDFRGPITKSPLQVAWDSGDAGKVGYYSARWVTRTGLVGPWSAIASMTIAA
jgi:hypothetical protein